MAGLKINLSTPSSLQQPFVDGFNHVHAGSFKQNLKDAYGYRYDPMYDSVQEYLQFNDVEYDEQFDITGAMRDEGMSDAFIHAYGSELATAKNAEHFQFISSRIQENLDRKQRLAKTQWYYPSQLIAGIVDPLNIAFAVPMFGGGAALTRLGAVATGSMGVKQASIASLKGSVAVSALSEGLRHPFDKTGTEGELIANLAIGTALGTVLGTTPSLARAGRRVLNTTGKRIVEDKTNRGFGDEISVNPQDPKSKKVKVVDVVDPEEPTVKMDLRKGEVRINHSRLVDEFESGSWKEDFGERAFDTPLEYINFRIGQEQARKYVKRKPGETKQEYDRRINLQAFNTSLRGYNFKEGSGANSLFYRFLTTPSKRIFTNPKVPNDVKRDLARLTADGALAFEGNKSGNSLALQSLEASQVKYNRQVDNLMRKLQKLYSDEQQTSSYTPLSNLTANVEKIRFRGSEQNQARLTFDEWFASYTRKFMDSKNEFNTSKVKNQTEEGVFEVLEEYFQSIDQRAQDIGLFVTPKKAKKLIADEEAKIAEKEQRIKELTKGLAPSLITGKQLQFKRALQNEIARSKEMIEWYSGVVKSGRTRQNFAFPMYYDKVKINSMRDDFTKIIATHFENTPKKLFWSDKQKKWLPGLTREEADARFAENKLYGIKEKVGEDFYILDPKKDAEEFVSRLLDETDVSIDFDKSPGAIGNKHLLTRQIDIPEHLIKDFLIVKPEVLYRYGELMGRKIEYERLFGGERLPEILARHEASMRAAGMTDKEIIKVKADFLVDYERVLRLQIKDPTRWDTNLARNAKAMANMAYLGSAGVSAIADAGFIVLQHGYGRINDMFNPLNFSRQQLKNLGISMEEATALSEMALLSQSQAKRRFVNDSIHPEDPKGVTKFMTKAEDVFFNVPIIGNNLGLVTKFIKTFDTMVRSSHILEYALKAKNKTLTDFELEWAQRHGLTLDDLIQIADRPWQRGNRDRGEGFEHNKGDWYLLNMDEWDVSTPEGRALVDKVDTAMDIGSRNTVFMASTMDKPAVMDGAIYFRHRPWMNAIGIKADKSSRGQLLQTGDEQVVRFESGMMTMPFSLLSWTLGAMTRFPMALVDNSRQHRIGGTLALLGMSYFVLGLKKPDWWFESKDSAEIAQRVIDHAGITGLYGDIWYNAIHALEGMGYIDEDTPYIYGKYAPKSGSEALVGLGGAPLSLVTDITGAASDFLSGDTDEALNTMKRSVPFLSNRPKNMLGWPYSVLYSIADDMEELNVVGSGRQF